MGCLNGHPRLFFVRRKLELVSNTQNKTKQSLGSKSKRVELSHCSSKSMSMGSMAMFHNKWNFADTMKGRSTSDNF